MPPLQTSYLETGDPGQFLVILAAIALIVLIVSLINHFKKGPGSGKGRLASTGKGPGYWALRKTAAQFGLSGDETNFLGDTLTHYQINNPERIMANPATLDKVFTKMFHHIEKNAESEAQAESQKFLLFSIRQSVEAAQGGTARITSSRKIPDGYPATIKTDSGDQYPTRLFGTDTDRLMAESPRNAVGTIIKFPRGTRFQVSFYAKSNQGFIFESKTLGTDSHDGTPVTLLAHSEHVSALPSRKHKRQTCHISTSFSLARIIEYKDGKKTTKKLEVDQGSSNGIMTDISAGGCAMKSVAPIRAGEYLKLEFSDLHDRRLQALGRIVRTNKTSGIGGIMHIQFIKVPVKTSNSIQALVYGYESN